ncbi:MAG: hypothetical protein WCF23_04240 [Candidatus Nitrosopolaris sp.]
MNSKTSIAHSSVAIVAIVLLFASDPIVGNQLAFAGGHHHDHHHRHHHHHHR